MSDQHKGLLVVLVVAAGFYLVLFAATAGEPDCWRVAGAMEAGIVQALNAKGGESDMRDRLLAGMDAAGKHCEKTPSGYWNCQ